MAAIEDKEPPLDQIRALIPIGKESLGLFDSATTLSPEAEFKLYFESSGPKLRVGSLRERAYKIDLQHCRVRSVFWKVFLQYVPDDTSIWSDILKEKRNEYEELRSEYLQSVPDERASNDLVMDNPLAVSENSAWNEFYKDNDLKTQIKLDLERTYPDNVFFSSEIITNMMLDILFIFAKLNPDISYRQGMNELLAPLVLINVVQSTLFNESLGDSEEHELYRTIQNVDYCAHDSFWMFHAIMSKMGPYFVNHTNQDTPPITQRCRHIQETLLRQVDVKLARHLKQVEIEPQLYGLRWIRLFFSREFHLIDVCIVWDSIFADAIETEDSTSPSTASSSASRRDSGGFEFVDYMCLAMLLFIKPTLITGNNSDCLRRIMRYPPIEDIKSLIQSAYSIRAELRKGKRSQAAAKISGAPVLPRITRSDVTQQISRISSSVTTMVDKATNEAKKFLTREERRLQKQIEIERALGGKLEELLGRLQPVVIKSTPSTVGRPKEPAQIFQIDDPDDEEIDLDEIEDILSGNVKPEVESKQSDPNLSEEKGQTLNEQDLGTIQEAMAELKLVKDALLGNLDSEMLEHWLQLSWDDGQHASNVIDLTPSPQAGPVRPRRAAPGPPPIQLGP